MTPLFKQKIAPSGDEDAQDVYELELSDEDILDAMGRIPGYLDITTSDFRLIYHLAHHHALDRLVAGMRAETFLRPVAEPLDGALSLYEAALRIARSGFKGLPVLDERQQVVGILTEHDYLDRLGVTSFLDLMLRLVDGHCELGNRCHDTRVFEVMTHPVVTLQRYSTFRDIVHGFERHSGRGMPVLDEAQRLLGMLYRKDLLSALPFQSQLP